MVENVDPPIPAKNLAISIPENKCVTPQSNCATTNNMPEAIKTGLRPWISEKGARTIGATANPQVKIVIPVKPAT
jgi:hypothetical protein